MARSAETGLSWRGDDSVGGLPQPVLARVSRFGRGGLLPSRRSFSLGSPTARRHTPRARELDRVWRITRTAGDVTRSGCRSARAG